MVSPQSTSNGYVAGPQQGVMRWHHGKKSSTYYVRRRQDNERNQKESYQTSSIKNPVNRYSRQIGQGVGIDKQHVKANGEHINSNIVELNDTAEEADDEKEQHDPDLVIGPKIHQNAADGGASTIWLYFTPLNSSSGKCNKCHVVIHLPSSGSDFSGSSSPMVQHLMMKCLSPEEYKEFIRKRETRYENKRKILEKRTEGEHNPKKLKATLMTSVEKEAPIWFFFKRINTEFARCLANDCFMLIRIVRETASALILHLGSDHGSLHDFYIENHQRPAKELCELLEAHQKEEKRARKIEKAEQLVNKAVKHAQNTTIQEFKPDAQSLLPKAKSLFDDVTDLTVGQGNNRKFGIGDSKSSQLAHEDFSNSSSSIREYFVPLGMLYAKCKLCYATLSIRVSKNR